MQEPATNQLRQKTEEGLQKQKENVVAPGFRPNTLQQSLGLIKQLHAENNACEQLLESTAMSRRSSLFLSGYLLVRITPCTNF